MNVSYTKTRIKVESFDSNLVTSTSQNIIETIKKTVDGKTKGPIPLPTKKRIYCVLRSPHVDKKSREHFEKRTHVRLLEILIPKNIPNIEDAFVKIETPPGISIKLL